MHNPSILASIIYDSYEQNINGSALINYLIIDITVNKLKVATFSGDFTDIDSYQTYFIAQMITSQLVFFLNVFSVLF